MADSSSQERKVNNEVAPDPSMVAEVKRVLLEYGNGLLTTGDSTEELLNKLDRLEHLLQHLCQECKSMVEESLEPAKKALISNELLSHAKEDVRITVTSCISEIIRITAPDEPYEEDQMKDFFQLANAAYQKLPSMAGRAYSKAVSVLQTISYSQICVMMLDFELHDMVHEMFNLFLNGIQSSHPQAVFSSMEHIMILIIQNNEDSDEFSVELAKILLAILKKGNQNVSPLAFQLAKNVFENCASNLKNYLPEAVRCMGSAIKEYDDVVVSSFRDATQREMDVEETRIDASSSGEVDLAGDGGLSMLLENNLIDNLKNDENVNENYGTVLHSCDQINQQESVSQDSKETGLAAISRGEFDLPRDGGLSKLVECRDPDTLKIDANVDENCGTVSYFGDQINNQESVLGRIHFTPGSDVDCPSKDDVTKFPTENSDTKELRNYNTLPDQNVEPLHSCQNKSQKSVDGIMITKHLNDASCSLEMDSPEGGNAGMMPLKEASHMKDHDILIDENSSEQHNLTDTIINCQPENVGGIIVVQQELNSDDVSIPSKRIRKPHSLIKPEEGYDPLWILSQRISTEGSRGRKNAKSKMPHLLSSHVVEPSTAPIYEKQRVPELKPQKWFVRENKDAVVDHENGQYLLSTSVNTLDETVPSKDIAEIESTKQKLDQISGKDLLAGDGILKNPVKRKRSSTKVALSKHVDKSLLANRIDGIQKRLEKGQGSSNKVDRAEKSQCKSIISEDISGDILIKTLVSRSRNISSKGVNDSVEVSNRQCQSEVILHEQENQSKKRRHSLSKKAPRDTSKEMASKVNPAGKCFGEDMVGCKIKVWWPQDRTFYEGKVTAFNSSYMKHQVDYDDGDMEILDLAHECWEMIDDNLSSHERNMVPLSTVRSRDPGHSSTSSSRKKLKGLWKQILG